MQKQRRHAVAAILAAACIGPAAQAQTAPAWPSKPITIVYPFAVGSASDTLTRQVGEILTKALGQPVLVDSKPGAGGSTALEIVTKAAPDGHTLGLSSSGTIAVNPHIYNLKYRPLEDLEPVMLLTEIPFIVVANNDVPITNLKDFIALAKSKPGKIAFGNAGIGTQAHLTQMMFLKAAGITANVIAYKGGTPAAQDMIGGHIDAMIDNAASQVPYVTGGKVRPLFVSTSVRSPALPNVPTAAEAGLPDFVKSGWFGLVAPRGTPKAVIDRVQAAVAKAFAEPEMNKKLVDAGWIVLASTPDAAAARSRSDYDEFGSLVKELQIKPN